MKPKKGTKKTWTTFTYYRPKIKIFINLFKHTNVGIAFKNMNTVKQITKPRTKKKKRTQQWNL